MTIILALNQLVFNLWPIIKENFVHYLLRLLLTLTVLGILGTVLLAKKILVGPFGHIQIAIPAFLFTIFCQAFVMFYFIGVDRFVKNIYHILKTEKDLNSLFDDAPKDLGPYTKKVEQFYFQAENYKRQSIPWAILSLILGMLAFLLGGAHDTAMVPKYIHSGVVYGFSASLLIGAYWQWLNLGRANTLLRNIKNLFSISDHQM